MSPGVYSEDGLVEQPAIRLFKELGWETVNATDEALGAEGTLGRDVKGEVILGARLRSVTERLNPGVYRREQCHYSDTESP